MGDNYLGEIRLFSFAKIPTGWAVCDGRTLQIAQNQALYSLLSNKYGGDGKTTFALPDLRGRVPVHTGQSSLSPHTIYNMGATGGAETVTLTTGNLPIHTHSMSAVAATATLKPDAGNLLAEPTDASNVQHAIYGPATNSFVILNTSTISNDGGNGSHNNMQPFQVLNYCIATSGLYPMHA